MTIKSLHLTGTGHSISFSAAIAAANGVAEPTRGFQAKWMQAVPADSNAGNVLVGGSEVTSLVGFPLPGGSSQFLPEISAMHEFYCLATIFFYLATGDAMDILYATD